MRFAPSSRYALTFVAVLLALVFIAETSHAHGSLEQSAPGCSTCALSHGCPLDAAPCLGIEQPGPVGAVELVAARVSDDEVHRLLPARAPPAV